MVAIAFAAVVPWLPLLHVFPWGSDSTRWIGFANLQGQWSRWVWDRKHFVGYRPITALSFVFDHAVAGYAAEGYRLTDLALHLATVFGFLGVCRAWAAPTVPGAALAVAFVLGHPALEEVVPFPSRRSYLLAMAFGFVGLLLHERSTRARTRAGAAGAAIATAAALFLAVLSNEIAYVLLPLLFVRPWLDGAGTPRWRILLTALPTVAVGASAVAMRWRVLGTVGGGYQKRYFAYVHDHAAVWTVLDLWEPGRIASALARYLLVPVSADADGPLLPIGPGQNALACVLFAWVAWVGVVEPLRRWSDPRVRRRLTLTAWLVGSAGIVVLSETWFWRQAYALLFPLGALIAATVADAARTGTRRDRAAVVGGALLFLTTAPFGSLPGVHVAQHAQAIEGSRLVRAVERLSVRGPGTVWLCLNGRSNVAQMARIWLDRRAERTGRRHRVLASLARGARPERTKVTLETDAVGERWLRLSTGMEWIDVPGIHRLLVGDALHVDGLWQRERRRRTSRTWLAVAVGAGTWREELFEPPDGVTLEARDPPPPPEDDEP